MTDGQRVTYRISSPRRRTHQLSASTCFDMKKGHRLRSTSPSATRTLGDIEYITTCRILCYHPSKSLHSINGWHGYPNDTQTTTAVRDSYTPTHVRASHASSTVIALTTVGTQNPSVIFLSVSVGCLHIPTLRTSVAPAVTYWKESVISWHLYTS